MTAIFNVYLHCHLPGHPLAGLSRGVDLHAPAFALPFFAGVYFAIVTLMCPLLFHPRIIEALNILGGPTA